MARLIVFLFSSLCELSFQGDNRNLRAEVATLREELTTFEAKYQDKYRNALRKNQDALADIKDNEFRYGYKKKKRNKSSRESVPFLRIDRARDLCH